MQIIVAIGIALMGIGAMAAGFAALYAARAAVLMREENEMLKCFIRDAVKSEGGFAAAVERKLGAHTKGKVQ